MTALPFAWRSLVRQPARSSLGIVGVAAVGALLFDMLLLSEGLVISMRELLDRMGFEIRVISTDTVPRAGPDLADGAQAAREIARLPSVRSVVTIRTESARLQHGGVPTEMASLLAAGGPTRPWTVLRGRDLAARRELVVNEFTARTLRAEPGASVTLQAYCSQNNDAAPPSLAFRIVGVAEFLFDAPETLGAAVDAADLAEACAQSGDAADFLAVISTGDPDAAAAQIAALRPDLVVLTNEQVLGQLQQRGFTYFRQISTVLTAVTVSFALLLITVLLTVSVNQRLGEVAALRALGFSQRRVVLDVLCESALIIGIGGALSLPLGWLLAVGLDAILKQMPGVPAALHFFVFRPGALATHLTLAIQPGDHLAIQGPSGCGKSTLLHMLGCVDTPSAGTLLFGGRNVATLGDRARSLLRLRHIGFVFQRFYLLPMLTAAENVDLPQSEAGVPARERRRRSLELLDFVGLGARADHRPSQLSGGEMQRVAIARALANRPQLVLADEPTGELDQATGQQVAGLLDRVNADGTALVIVTHDQALAGRARRVLTMRDGRIEGETAR